MQNWAGSGWGGQIIPRIGMEVMVTYLDGDPDRPVVTGVVPNAKQKVPYKLPENKTRSIIRSNSHKSSGFNEFTLEDKTGAENMFFHAQRDQTTRVLKNRTARIDRHDIYSVGGNRAIEVGSNQKQDIGGSFHLSVGGTDEGAEGEANRFKEMAKVTSQIVKEAAKASGHTSDIEAFAETIGKLMLGFFKGEGIKALEGVTGGSSPRADAGTDLAKSGGAVGDAAAQLFDNSGVFNTFVSQFQSDTVGIARVEQIGATKVTNVGKTRQVNVGKTEVKTVGETQETHVGGRKVINVGKTFDIEVGERFSIKVGDNSLVMDSSGLITIMAAKTTITKGGGAQFTIGPGPILYTPVLVMGASPGPGAPGVPKKTRKPFAEECADES
jgi:type VI secretion system secreted protein VgrG